MAEELDLHGLFEHNGTFDYSDYHDTDNCETLRSFGIIFVSILYCLAFVLGIVGNALVLVVLWKKRQRWSVMDTFVLYLSISDLLLLITLPLWIIEAVKETSLGSGVCKLTGGLFKMNIYCNIFLLGCMSLYLNFSAVCTWPVSLCRKHLICMAVLFSCILLTIPDWMYLEAKSHSEETDHTKCEHDYPSPASRLISRWFYHVFGFLLPSIVLLCCCTHVLLLCKSDQRVQKQRAVPVILILILAFFICWTPYNIALLVDTIHTSYVKVSGDCERRWTPVKSTAVIGVIHSCFNPLIYFGFSEKFRHWVINIAKCHSYTLDGVDFFPWNCREVDEATSVPQEENGSLQPMALN